jgi:hypothetical protein
MGRFLKKRLYDFFFNYAFRNVGDPRNPPYSIALMEVASYFRSIDAMGPEARKRAL